MNGELTLKSILLAVLLAGALAPVVLATDSHDAYLYVSRVEPVSTDPLLNTRYDVHVTVINTGFGPGTGTVYAWARPIWWGIADQYPSAPIALAAGERATVVIPWSSSIDRLVFAGEVGHAEFTAGALRDTTPSTGVDNEQYADGLYPIWLSGPPIPT